MSKNTIIIKNGSYRYRIDKSAPITSADDWYLSNDNKPYKATHPSTRGLFKTIHKIIESDDPMLTNIPFIS